MVETRKKYFKEHHLNKRISVLNHYCNNNIKCAHCCCKDIDCLTIDHIDGGGKKHMRNIGFGSHLINWLIKNNFPEGFQILCCNCQRIKKIENKECSYLKLGKTNTPKRGYKSLEKYLDSVHRAYNVLKTNVLSHYGNCCVMCGNKDIRVLELDHINNNGAEHRKIIGNPGHTYGFLKKNNYPNNPPFLLQVLCANCNHKKTKNH